MIDVKKGKALYDDGVHKFIWLGWQEEEQGELVQTNHQSIFDNQQR